MRNRHGHLPLLVNAIKAAMDDRQQRAPLHWDVATGWVAHPCVAGAAYVPFMFLIDVPMYWSRWKADQGTGRRYLSITQGLVDVCRRRIVSYRWEVWKTKVVWMSLYFSFGG